LEALPIRQGDGDGVVLKTLPDGLVRHTEVGRFRLVRPGSWSLWSHRGRVIGYVLTVDLAAVGLVLLCLRAAPVLATDLLTFAILLTCAVAYGEATRRVERLHRQDDHTPHTDLNSVWMFAGVLLLHPALTAIVIIVFHLHRWLRVAHKAAHRMTFSVAAGICGATAAAGILVLAGRYHRFAGLPHDLSGFAVLASAAVVVLVVDAGLVAVVIALASAEPSLRASVGDWSGYAVEAATIALGALLAWALVDWQVMAVAIVGVTMVLHGRVLIHPLRTAASTDAKTGLLNTAAWYAAGQRQLDRASRQQSSVGVLIIDLDHFKRVNDVHGHLAGDQVLVAVAKVITGQVRGSDLVGRFGGEEFVVLLPVADGAELVRAADRIRQEIAGLTLRVTGHHGTVQFRGQTASVGIAVFPRHGDTLDKLLRAADKALFAAKAAGRDQIQLAGLPRRRWP
jgi:diguanylate cyclase (GGDEF)-like protein